ncbi:MAG: insulinase family protein [Chloracidobacterium sp.]|nr:insulinase family protein [Chloracidobacterium sp.]MCO5333873.1 insulinase family protein [Pyrinomonadaceae bacterium]
MKDSINETRLDSGAVVLSDRMEGARSATLGFFFRVGARDEPEGLNGISHFIEHTVFKGTSRRTALDIAIEQDRLGGNLDAFTTHEETGFAIKVIDDRLPRAFDLIADMLLEPRFAEPDLKSEQKVIIEELKMVEDSPEDHLGEVFAEAYFAGHPLGKNIAGTAASVNSFDHDITERYHKARFTAAELVIAAAGNIDHDALVEMAIRYGFATPNGSEAPRQIVKNEPQPAAPFIVKANETLEQAHFILAAPLVGAGDPRRYAADILANLIGGGTSSRLWQQIREQRGLAYSVGAAATLFRDCGIFSVSAATAPEHLEEAVKISVAEMSAVAKDGVTDDELELAKEQARTSLLLSLEDSASRTASLAQSEMTHGRQITIEEVMDQIDSVSADDCGALAAEFFSTDKLAFAALGDIDELSLDHSILTV